MLELPKDVNDLLLAPVILAVERRLEELGALDVDELADRVALESDANIDDPARRVEGLLRTVAYLQEMHDWDLAWDERGIRLTHGAHSVVLGAPKVFAQFLTAVGPGSRFTLGDPRGH